MKRAVTAVLLLSVLLFSAVAWAVAPPVFVMHQVKGFKVDGKTAIIDVSLRVSNPGKTSLSNLTLSFMPLPPFTKGGSTLNVGTLTTGQTVELTLHLQEPFKRGKAKDDISRRPLFFAGKYQDAAGKTVEFPVTSHPRGGAK